MFFNSKKVIGLDIGSNSIKMAELDVSRNGAKLVAFGVVPAQPNSFNNGDITDVDGVVNAIRNLISNFRIKQKNVSMGMSGTSVIVKKISIPRIDKKLLNEQIRWEAEQYIPFDVNNISLAHHLVESTSTSETMDILLVAAQNQVVSTYNNVVSSAGLKLSVLDVSGFALANAFEFNYGKMPGQTIGLLNMGSSTTNFVVVHNGEVIFSRDMNVGGQNYTYEIHKELGVSLPEAEALKLSAVRGEGVPDEVHSLISSGNESFKEEIRNSFDYFAGSASNMNMSQVFYCGGSSGTPGLIESMSQASGLRFEPLNPMLRVNGIGKAVSSQLAGQMAPLSAIVLGLALRKQGDA